MFSEEKWTMKILTKLLSKSQIQWLWFIGLWCGGLGIVLALSYIIKIAMGI